MKTWHFAFTLVAPFLLGCASSSPKTSTTTSAATSIAPNEIGDTQFSLNDIKPLVFNPDQLRLTYETVSVDRPTPIHIPTDIIYHSSPKRISQFVLPAPSYPDRYFNEALIDTSLLPPMNLK
jgi:hypothetical protein